MSESPTRKQVVDVFRQKVTEHFDSTYWKLVMDFRRTHRNLVWREVAQLFDPVRVSSEALVQDLMERTEAQVLVHPHIPTVELLDSCSSELAEIVKDMGIQVLQARYNYELALEVGQNVTPDQ